MKKSIGIDVSMDTLDVAVYDGKSVAVKRYANSEAGFVNIEHDYLKTNTADILISMEATGVYYLKAAVFFHKRGYPVSVLNPLIIKRYSEMKMLRAKTDSVDAKTIAKYGFHEKPCYFTPKDDIRDSIVQLLKQIEAIQKMQSENKSQIHAYERIPVQNETVISIYREIAMKLQSEKRRAEQEIEKIIDMHYAQKYKELISIPGVGNRLSSLVIGFFGEFEKFENSKKVSCFIGLNPSPKESGISVNGRGAISKKGNIYMRKIFYMAALSASKYNKCCRELYERLLARGKSKRVALIAVANKLLRQIFAIVKNNRIYDENFEKKLVLC
jgi:transposase